MNELVTTQQQSTGLAISKDTKALIVSGISDNTLKIYRRATREFKTWLNGQILNPPLLVTYINPSSLQRSDMSIECRYFNACAPEERNVYSRDAIREVA